MNTAQSRRTSMPSDTFGLFGVRLNAVYGSVDSGIDETRGDRSLLAAALDFRPSDSVTVTLDAEHIEKRVNEPGVFRYVRLPTPTPTDLYPALELPPLLDGSVNFGPDWAEDRGEERNALAAVSWKHVAGLGVLRELRRVASRP